MAHGNYEGRCVVWVCISRAGEVRRTYSIVCLGSGEATVINRSQSQRSAKPYVRAGGRGGVNSVSVTFQKDYFGSNDWCVLGTVALNELFAVISTYIHVYLEKILVFFHFCL